MPCKVDYADLESVTKFLDKLDTSNTLDQYTEKMKVAKQLSKMIKDKYTEIKPYYEQ